MKENERILKRFFEAGVTPDFAQNSEDRKALEGCLNQFLKMYCVGVLLLLEVIYI